MSESLKKTREEEWKKKKPRKNTCTPMHTKIEKVKRREARGERESESRDLKQQDQGMDKHT